MVTTGSPATTTSVSSLATTRTELRLRWWVEVAIIAVYYGIYSGIRDLHGANSVNKGQALHNANRIIDLERDLGIFDEQHVQHVFLHFRWMLSVLNDFYASAHFLAVGGVLIWLFFAQPERYRRWRNTLALCTGLALIGFAFFPVLPPRLLPFAEYHFVDTLKTIGGLWNFSSGPANDVSDQYAAMPSLHTAWSTWCACAVASSWRSWWKKVAVMAYPLLTVFCIIVTGNHYFLDALGGLVVLAGGFALARVVSNVHPERPRIPAERQPVEAHA